MYIIAEDFYPTPKDLIIDICEGLDIEGKVFLEPSAGGGDIVDYLKAMGASNVLACEKHEKLAQIIASKCKLIANDFLTVTSDQVSHIDGIVMNPPFSADVAHIMHAWDIAPAGCRIVAVCNAERLKNPYSRSRARFETVVKDYGYYTFSQNEFSLAERKSNVEIAIIHLQKPANDYKSEFEGFFMEEDIEEQSNGIMPYNVVRDLVNRYTEAVKLYDKQLELGVQMNNLTSGFYTSKFAFSLTEEAKPKSRAEFKKDLQKSGWKWIFNKMNMEKYSTRGLKEDLNKFVEHQQNIPFTMKNIYKMLEVVVGTNSSRMDQALLEVFDKLTERYYENRYNVPGWKTNSHYLINQKFILDFMVAPSFSGKMELKYNSNGEIIEDMMKALCFLTGKNYDDFISLDKFFRYRYKLKSGDKYLMEDKETYKVHYGENELDKIQREQEKLNQQGIKAEIENSRPDWGEWFDWGFFQCRCYKKGTMHFKFKDLDLWGKYNQHIARIKGYPLFESVSKK